MMKRFIALALCLVLLLGCTTAGASVATLDTALARWLEAYPNVRFSATLTLNALPPFTTETLTLFNNVLKHTTVNAQITQTGEDSATGVQIAMDSQALLTMSETEQGGAYALQTSLLANRTLTSSAASPMDLLLAPQAEETQPVAENDTPQADQKKADTVNTSDIADAFSLLDAVPELQACYQALTDGVSALATEKRANYNIKGIGAGKWSRVARMTVEQSAALAEEIRAVLVCGMDAAYRAEIAQVTFDKGFVVALYQNADKQDICVYLKGTVTYPDGSQRKLLWQWAFTTNGLKRKDALKYEVSRLNGNADSRIIAATCTQESRSDAFSIAGKTETTLKRSKVTDKSTARVDLEGKQGDDLTMTCKGNVSQELAQTIGTDTEKSTENATVDLLFTPDDDGAVISGNVVYQTLVNKDVGRELAIAFATDAPLVQPVAQTGSSIDAAAQVAGTQQPDATTTTSPQSSLEMIDDAFTVEPDSQTEYLVGTAPEGLKTYTPPQAMTTVDMDHASASQRDALVAEAAQGFAGKLLLAVAALPQEDAALLGDSMTEQDYAAFTALLNAL